MPSTITNLAVALLLALPLSGLTVDNLGDAPDANPGDGVCAIAGGGCTLRAATQEANASGNVQTITFSVAGTITPATAYPPITGELRIDGKSAPGYSTPVVIIDGGGSIPIGFDFTASAEGFIRGLEIRGFSTTAISISGGWVSVSACYLGPVRGGTPNGDGVQLQSTSHACSVGGSSLADRSVISGNSRYGIRAEGADQWIQFNYIGTNASGTAALPNGSDGIRIGPGGSHVVIDSFTRGNNVVSGNGGNGIALHGATGAEINGAFIGTNAAGTAAIPNALDGIAFTSGAHDNLLGGVDGPNVIAGNKGHGISIDSSCSGNHITFSYIGLLLDTQAALGNKGHGISDSGTNTRIDQFASVIANNALDGIYLANSTGTKIQAAIVRSNGGNGIHVNGASSVTIEDLWIERNKADGVRVDGNASGVSIMSNDIRDNGKLGIDLNGDGVTLNDTRDSDGGANGLQNFPVIVSASEGPNGITAQGTLNSTPNTSFDLQLFQSPDADPATYGEGEAPLGTAHVTTDGNGNATFSVTGDLYWQGPKYVTATATGPNGTSEFSRAVLAADPPAIQFSSAAYSVAEDGGTATITVTRSGNATVVSSVNYAASDATAAQPGDYGATSGTLTFDYGVTSRTFTIPIVNDATHEPAETVNLTLSTPSLATLGAQSTAVLTIADDDPVPAIAIDDVTLDEGNSGTKTFTFTVTLSNPSATAVSVDYATAAGTASAGSDYANASGTLTFASGVTTRTITVDVNGDTIFESDETFVVNLATGSHGTGTIVNDDAEPAITIDNVAKSEGNAGTTTFTFTLTRTAGSALTDTFTYTTAPGTATSGIDFTPASGTLIFAPGMTTQTIDVDVLGDTLFEQNETFFVNLSNGTHGRGTIVNDDAASATLSIAMTSEPSWFTPGQAVLFRITVTNAGPGAATGVAVTDALPSSLTLLSATSPEFTCSGTTSISCSASTLANGATATISLVAIASGAEPIVNTATVTATGSDPASATTQIIPAPRRRPSGH